HNGRGSALQHMARYQQALESFDCAIAIAPDYAEAHYNRGNALRALSLPDLALKSYERALTLKPDFVDDYYNRGSILHELKRSDEALQRYERPWGIDREKPWLQGILLHARLRLCEGEGLESQMADLTARLELGKAVAPPFVMVTATDSPALQRRAAEVWIRE